MKKSNKIFWGLLFLLGAVALIISGLGYFEGVNFWNILLSIALIGIMVKGIFNRQYGCILFPLAIMAILYDDLLGIEAITPWPVLGAALLGTIGLSILFPKYKKNQFKVKKSFQSDIGGDSLDGENVFYQVRFGEAVKYLTGNELSNAQLNCSFGSMSVYFDNAFLKNGRADVNVHCSFGELDLYIPSCWKVSVDVDSSFGGVEETGHCSQDGTNTVFVRGNVAFGELVVHYI